MNKINMKHWIYSFVAIVVMSFAACSSDDDEGQPSNPNLGKDNTTDMAVTGGISDMSLLEDGNIKVVITGYLNLTDEMKLAMGSLMDYGIEYSDNDGFTESSTMRASDGLKDGRSFVVNLSLSEKTKYYYRTYLGSGSNNSMNVYGKTESFTTKSIEELLPAYKVETPDVDYVGETSVEIPGTIACDTDKSKLTAENIKNGNFAIHNLDSLESGTTYYYCAYTVFKEKHVVMGEVKSFTTKGYNVKELAKLVTVTEDGYTFTFKTQLASKYPDKNIQYGVKKYLTTSYFEEGTEGVEVCYRDRYERLTYYISKNDVTNYATGSGTTFTVTMPKMEYIATGIYDSSYGYTEWYEPTYSDYPDWNNPWAGAWNDADFAEEVLRDIEDGIAWDGRIEGYNAAVARLKDAYSKELYKYVSEVNEVFVEIDGWRYVVKTVKHEADVDWFTHFEFK